MRRGDSSTPNDPTVQLIKMIVWSEEGGPPVRSPRRRGFGSQLIEGAVVREFAGAAELSYAETGFVARLTIPLAESRPWEVAAQ